MKTTSLFIQAAVVGAALAWGTAVRANGVPLTQTVDSPGATQLQMVAFRDTAEAKALRNAYIILATGDHDYNGHRVGAMKQVKAAADLLGLDLSGDTKDRQPQPLSDDKLRDAKGMIVQVVGAAEVKDQKRVVKHLNEALHQINVALSTR